MTISDRFPRIACPGTGRTAVQLTSGPGYCYPLYYFIPSITADGRYMVYHWEHEGEIQLYRLDLQTAESVQLTRGTCPDAGWKPWGVDPARGILGDRSALAVARGEVVYFDGNAARAVHVESQADRPLFALSDDRFPLAQNGCTPDGQWFVYIHADRDQYMRLLAKQAEEPGYFRHHAHECEAVALCAHHLGTGEDRTLIRINCPIHHVFAYDDRHVVFCHPPGEKLGMMWTDLKGGWYTLMRPQDEAGGKICHYVATAKGIDYEVVQRNDGRARCGRYNPFTHARYEFEVPSVSHVGCDPSGERFFVDAGGGCIRALLEHDPEGKDNWIDLAGPWKAYGKGQKTHLHPRITPDSRWIQLVGGDPASETNHIFLLDLGDVPVTAGLPPV